MEQQVYTRIAFDTPAVRPRVLYLVAKRLLDLFGSLFGLLLLFPVFLLLAILVRRDSPGAIFHRRRVLERQDYKGGTPRTFDAFKFRTMIADADDYLQKNPHLMREFQKDYKLRDDPRVTPFGSKLRTTSLDELPQLMNVLRGQMSLVGPRMISPPELEMYGEHGAKLLSVKPGITGLWQVSGRQHVSYRERVGLDMEYIDNQSFLLDLQILLRTVKCVLLRKGAF
jgi:lipopolysaccharide/colanic/teichoic acid biosynthesis glycosyltransferase